MFIQTYMLQYTLDTTTTSNPQSTINIQHQKPIPTASKTHDKPSKTQTHDEQTQTHSEQTHSEQTMSKPKTTNPDRNHRNTRPTHWNPDRKLKITNPTTTQIG